MRKIKIIYLALITLCALQINSISAEVTLEQLEAKEVVERYFDALKQGDTGSVQSLLDGDLLTTRKDLLNNPTYPDTLIELYKETSYEITAMETLDDGLVAVDTKVSMNSQESMSKRFLLQRTTRENTTSDQLYIIAEIETN